MRSFKRDTKTGDLVIKDGRIEFVTDINVVMQNCETVIRQHKNELSYDKNKGIEYINNVFAGQPNLQQFESQARQQILAVDGVTSIIEFEYNVSEHILDYSIVIRTIYGEGRIIGRL